jgi:hypothetical protein
MCVLQGAKPETPGSLPAPTPSECRMADLSNENFIVSGVFD